MDFTKLNAEIRILLVLPSSQPIPMHRLSPAHANLRVQVAEGAQHPATPLYNTALQLAYAPRRRLLAVHNAKRAIPAYADALVLLRVWANQRGYGSGPQTTNVLAGFEQRGAMWAALLELVVFGEETGMKKGRGEKRRRPLGRGLSSYQLFKATLDFIGECGHPCHITSPDHTPASHDFRKNPSMSKSEDGMQVRLLSYRETMRR
jgi:U3 small nucleolar RNA-associated protein 22